MPTNPSRSIYTLKSQFLHSQVQTLSHLPKPSTTTFRSTLPPADEHGDLSDATITAVYYKLDVQHKKHHATVYSTQALRHVAEQINSLYAETTNGYAGAPAREDDVLRAGVDLTRRENIDALPEAWPGEEGEDEGEDEEDEEEEEMMERYQELRERLLWNAELLKAQRQRHAYYSRLKDVVEPFNRPIDAVQPNLVTKEGAVNSEMERTRVLAAKIAMQVAKAQGKLEHKGGDLERDLEMAATGRGVDAALKRLLEGV